MTIISITENDYPAWDAYVLQHPQSNPYLLSAWGRAITNAYGHKMYWLTAEDESGELVGLLPLVHIKHLIFGNGLFSMPYADLGGVIAENDQIVSTLVNHAVSFATENSILT